MDNNNPKVNITSINSLKAAASFNDMRIAHRFLSGKVLTADEEHALSYFDGAEIRLLAAEHDNQTI